MVKARSPQRVSHILRAAGAVTVRPARLAFMWVVRLVENNPMLERHVNKIISVVPGLERMVQALVMRCKSNLAGINNKDGIAWNLPAESAHITAWEQILSEAEMRAISPAERD